MPTASKVLRINGVNTGISSPITNGDDGPHLTRVSINEKNDNIEEASLNNGKILSKPHTRKRNFLREEWERNDNKQADAYITYIASIVPQFTRCGSKRAKHNRRKCSAPNCQNGVIQRGVCITHGAKRKLCSHQGCTKKVKSGGSCSKHGPPRKKCESSGCTRVAVQGGRCFTHGANICHYPSKVPCKNKAVFKYGGCNEGMRIQQVNDQIKAPPMMRRISDYTHIVHYDKAHPGAINKERDEKLLRQWFHTQFSHTGTSISDSMSDDTDDAPSRGATNKLFCHTIGASSTLCSPKSSTNQQVVNDQMNAPPMMRATIDDDDKKESSLSPVEDDDDMIGAMIYKSSNTAKMRGANANRKAQVTEVEDNNTNTNPPIDKMRTHNVSLTSGDKQNSTLEVRGFDNKNMDVLIRAKIMEKLHNKLSKEDVSHSAMKSLVHTLPIPTPLLPEPLVPFASQTTVIPQFQNVKKTKATKRATATAAAIVDSTRAVGPCTCKKNKCLKLYCVCLAAEEYCHGCSCDDCQNTPEYDEVQMAEKKHKKQNKVEGSQSCGCKNSACLKKYCECFAAGMTCGPSCKCINCKNLGSEASIYRRQQMAESAMKSIVHTLPSQTTNIRLQFQKLKKIKATKAAAAKKEQEEAQPAADQKPTNTRKEKSLGTLCSNFLELFKNAPSSTHDDTGTTVEIFQVTDQLGVDKRRLYDVISILVAFDIVCRVEKNTYRWNGKEGLPRWFAELQRSGLEEAAAKADPGQDPNDIPSSIGDGGKIKGMAQICQKLIQIFLVTGCREIALSEAAETILPFTAAELSDRKAMKQMTRRLYDIANLLQAIGILKKTKMNIKDSDSKPGFRWAYPIRPQDMHNYLGA